MAYKKSMYNMEVEPDKSGNILIYNSLSMSLGLMEQRTKALYENVEKLDVDRIIDENIKQDIEIMKNNGFIVDEDTDEYLQLKIMGEIAKYNKTGLSLTVAPTLDCNMACPYCFENKSNLKMSQNTKNKFIDFIKDRIKEDRISSLKISWYGGEPLLQLDTILELSLKIIDICNLNNVHYWADIVTNGSLLDAEKAMLLREKCKVSRAQITLDGLSDEHNKRRVLKNGEDSFNRIVGNIDEIKDILSISIRINVDKDNMENAERLIDFFLKKKQWGSKVNFYFAPLENISEKCGIMSNTCYTYAEFGEINRMILRKIYNNGYSNIVRAQVPKPTTLFCSALTTNAFVVDPEGYLYTCWSNVGRKEKSVGTLDKGAVLNREYLDWLSLEHPEGCKSCTYLPVCHGGCPLERMKNGNKANCGYNTVSMKENFLVEYEEYLAKRNIYR
jgi:uncharacterized protein